MYNDYCEYCHEEYAATARLEWLILGCCPIGDRQEGDPAGFMECGKWNIASYGCDYVPGGNGWAGGARCSPIWIKRYNIPKRRTT
jgi:hypothetical protein